MPDSFTFKNLWKNHPEIADNGKACIGGGFPQKPGEASPTIGNQCAINVSVAFEKCGVEVGKWGIQLCNLARVDESHKNHAIRAEELANELRKRSVKGVGSLQKITSEDFNISLAGKTGIIFFKDYWRRKNPVTGKKETFENRSGDHIDFWDGSQTTSASSLRLNWFPEVRIGSWGWSDLEDSKAIWFWAVA